MQWSRCRSTRHSGGIHPRLRDHRLLRCQLGGWLQLAHVCGSKRWIWRVRQRRSAPKTGCETDLNKRCPAELRVVGGDACKSACEAFGNPDTVAKARMAHQQPANRRCTPRYSSLLAPGPTATLMMMPQVLLHVLELIIPSHSAPMSQGK
ncbi:hypothetical protein SLE2022_330070 [Rubroshorea leprosula]